MKKLLVLCAGALLVFSNCKEKSDPEELLIGDWNVTSAINSNGEELIGDDSLGYIVSMYFNFTENKVVWTEVDEEKSTGEKNEYPILGDYTWTDGKIDIVFYDFGDTLLITGEASFPEDNRLNLNFLNKSEPDESLKVTAERK